MRARSRGLHHRQLEAFTNAFGITGYADYKQLPIGSADIVFIAAPVSELRDVTLPRPPPANTWCSASRWP
jgi:hypothetical protein